jgi:hypothetical protein
MYLCYVDYLALVSSNLDPITYLFFRRTEVLHYTGLLEELPSFSEEQTDMMQDLKGGIMKRAEGFRVQVRRRLNPQTLQKFAADEKSVTLGTAGGAILGFLL